MLKRTRRNREVLDGGFERCDAAVAAADARSLARARIAAGAAPHDPAAQLVHAVAAAVAGRATEAADASGRCRDAAASWQRTEYVRQLRALEAAHPDFAAPLASVRRALSDARTQ